MVLEEVILEKILRKFFEVDKEHLVAYGLSVLAKEQLIASNMHKEAIKKYNIDERNQCLLSYNYVRHKKLKYQILENLKMLK